MPQIDSPSALVVQAPELSSYQDTDRKKLNRIDIGYINSKPCNNSSFELDQALSVVSSTQNDSVRDIVDISIQEPTAEHHSSRVRFEGPPDRPKYSTQMNFGSKSLRKDENRT